MTESESADAPLTLYGCPNTRSLRAAWALEEAGAEYAYVPVALLNFGQRFDGADILLAHTLAWARSARVPVLPESLLEYADRCLARPAAARAMQREAAAPEASARI